MTRLLTSPGGFKELTIEEILRRKREADLRGEDNNAPSIEPSGDEGRRGLGFDYGILFTDAQHRLQALMDDGGNVVHLQDDCEHVFYDDKRHDCYTARGKLGGFYMQRSVDLDVGAIVRILHDKDDILFVGETGRMRTLRHRSGYTLADGIDVVKDAVMYEGVPHFIREDANGRLFFDVYCDDGKYEDIGTLDEPSGLVEGKDGVYVVSHSKLYRYDGQKFAQIVDRRFMLPIGPLLVVREQERDMIYLGVKDGSLILRETNPFSPEALTPCDSGPISGIGIKSMTAAPNEYIKEMIAKAERWDGRRPRAGIRMGG